MTGPIFALAFALLAAHGHQAQPPPEATSLFGRPLYPPPVAADQKARLDADLAKAQADYDANPSDAQKTIWLGRRFAYLGRFRDAIRVYSDGIARHPDNAQLYRHRGHRYITVRDFDRAIADLSRAAALVKGKPDEVEPDGAPNRFNKPRSTLQSNIWYHLGLAQYLKGDFTAALDSYREAMKVSRVNDDMLVATSDWLYMTYRRLGRPAEAAAVLDPIKPEMDILENTAYHRRLLMYKGLVKPEALLAGDVTDPVQIATQGYGVANWYLYNGQPEKARGIFGKILEGTSWPAFGFIAAEADMKRGAAGGSGGQTFTGVAADVDRVEHARLDAMFNSDIDTVEKFIADDFMLTGGNGQVSDRTQYLARMRAATGPRPKLLHDDVKIRVHGDMAIVTGRSRSVVNGQERPGQTRYTHVYVRQNGTWRMVAMHTSSVATPQP